MIISIHPYISYYHFISSVHGIFVFTARQCAMLLRSRYCYCKSSICLSVRPSVHDVKVSEYHDHIGWNSSKLALPLVSLGLGVFPLYKPQHHASIPKRTPKTLTQNDPPPVEFSVADIRWQIAV